jgi:NADH:ubiquinone oxidoreductase subunit F (NADH-binding)
MGSQTPLTPVLSRYWDDPESWTLDTYRRNDGYKALQKALNTDPDEVLKTVKDSGLRPVRPPSRTTWWSTPTSRNPVRAKIFR